MAAPGFHRCQLELRCRVCGRKKDKAHSHKKVAGLEFEILSAFGVDTREDVADRHPSQLCSCCWKFVQQTCSAVPSSRVRETSVLPLANWPACQDDSCNLCEQWRKESKGGRPPKSTAGKRGRPKGSVGTGSVEANTGCAVAVQLPKDPALAARLASFQAGLPLLPERFVEFQRLGEDSKCPICKDVLDRPVAVPVPGCEHACCANCWEQWLALGAGSGSCPVCGKAVTISELQPLPRGLWLSLCNLQIHCDFRQNGCDTIVPLSQLRQHTKTCVYKSHCTDLDEAFEYRAYSTAQSQGTISSVDDQPTDIQPLAVDTVLATPVTEPISAVEDRLLGCLLRRLVHQHQTSVGLSVYTGGRRGHISYTPAGSQSASQSLRTLQRHHRALHDIGRVVSGNEETALVQRTYDVSHRSQEERQQLLFSAKVHYYVQPEEAVALSCHLRLTNEQLRKLRRWTKKWNLFLASERQTRALAVDKIGEVEIGAEMIQSVSTDEDGARSLHPAAYAWVKNLNVLVENHLSSLLEQDVLTWHSRGINGPALPSNELWLKIGGDKGGGSFKMAFQVVNQPRPNSADYTIVFSCLEADDNLANLHTALDHFKEAVHDLQQLHWR